MSFLTFLALREPERGFQIRLAYQKKKEKEAKEAEQAALLGNNSDEDSGANGETFESKVTI